MLGGGPADPEEATETGGGLASTSPAGGAGGPAGMQQQSPRKRSARDQTIQHKYGDDNKANDEEN